MHKIANHEMYSIDESGNVYSGKLGNTLAPVETPNGYLSVNLDKKPKLIHRLVALHFIPNPYNYTQVNHKDGDKHNNHVSNLEWCDPEANINHAWESGLHVHTGKRFIHVEDKRKLIQRVLGGELVSDLALECGFTEQSLGKSLRERAKKDGLGGQWKSEMARRRKLTALRNLEKVNVRN